MRQRTNQYVEVACLAYQLCQRVLRRYSHAHSPQTHRQPQVAACTLMVFYLRKTYRDAEELFGTSDQILAVLELERVPDHSTLCRMYHKLNGRRLLRLLRCRLAEQAPREAVIALDR